MRTQMFGSILLAALVGCGGGGGSNKPDAKIFLDAPIDAPPMCSVTAMLGPFSLGSATMDPPGRISGDWFDTETMGPLTGRVIFTVVGSLPSSTAAAEDILVIQVVKPAAGPFPTNTAINFTADPNATTYDAAAFLIGDRVPGSNPVTFTNFFFASSGSATFTAINDANGSQIDGMVSATPMREIDAMAGTDIAGGCATNIAGLSLALTEMTMALQPGTAPNWGEGGLKPLSAESLEATRQIIRDFWAKHPNGI